MNPFDLTFDEFNSNDIIFDDILQQEEEEESIIIKLEKDEFSYERSESSFSESFDDMPVYRSLDVMPSQVMECDSKSGIDMVYEPPMLMRGSSSSVESKVVDDLFANLEMEFTNTSIPCVSDVLGGVATTSVEIESSLAAISSSIVQFLQSRGIHNEYCELSSLWRCQKTDFVDDCKFNIQVYIHGSEPKNIDEVDTYTIEFLRISGSPLLFSKEFHTFKSTDIAQPETVISNISSLAPIDLSKSQEALKSFLDWASSAESDAVSAVTGIFKSIESNCPLLEVMTQQSECQERMSEEGILAMTLMASICAQFKQYQEKTTSVKSSSSLPLLSMLHLLLQTKMKVQQTWNEESCKSALLQVLSTLIDSLIPATARLTAATSRYRSTVSPFERDTASQMMEMVEACA